MELRLMAARKRTSISALIREKLGVKKQEVSRKDLWKRVDKFAGKIAKKYPKTNLSSKLIEMRYEQ